MEKEIVFVVAFHCLHVFNVIISDWFVRIGKVKKYCYICNVVVDYALSTNPLESSDTSVFGLSLLSDIICAYATFFFY